MTEDCENQESTEGSRMNKIHHTVIELDKYRQVPVVYTDNAHLLLEVFITGNSLVKNNNYQMKRDHSSKYFHSSLRARLIAFGATSARGIKVCTPDR